MTHHVGLSCLLDVMCGDYDGGVMRRHQLYQVMPDPEYINTMHLAILLHDKLDIMMIASVHVHTQSLDLPVQ